MERLANLIELIGGDVGPELHEYNVALAEWKKRMKEYGWSVDAEFHRRIACLKNETINCLSEELLGTIIKGLTIAAIIKLFKKKASMYVGGPIAVGVNIAWALYECGSKAMEKCPSHKPKLPHPGPAPKHPGR